MKQQTMDVNGWVIIDKPSGIGSTPVVSKVRRGVGVKKAGHAGTLDPFATGILPIALGAATKTIPYVQNRIKEYTFSLTFGKTTDTLDSTGTITQWGATIPTKGQIIKILPKFIGEIFQVPPAYCALKIKGRRAYDLARQGKQVILPPRVVTVKNLQFLGWESEGCGNFKVTCGKGTYVRALGRDIAESLGSKGYINALCRTRVGSYALECAISLEKFEKILHKIKCMEKRVVKCLEGVLLPLDSALEEVPAMIVGEEEAKKLCNGLALRASQYADLEGSRVFVVKTQARVVGFGRVEKKILRPVRIFDGLVLNKGK